MKPILSVRVGKQDEHLTTLHFENHGEYCGFLIVDTPDVEEILKRLVGSLGDLIEQFLTKAVNEPVGLEADLLT